MQITQINDAFDRKQLCFAIQYMYILSVVVDYLFNYIIYRNIYLKNTHNQCKRFFATCCTYLHLGLDGGGGGV